MYVPKCMIRSLMITVRRQLPPRKYDPQPKTNPNINSNPNQGGGGWQFSSRVIVWLPPNSKTNPNLDPNPNSNRGQFSSGGNCPDAEIIVYVTIKYFQHNLHKCLFSCLTVFWFSMKHIGKGFVTIPCCLHMFPFEYNQWVKCYPSGATNCQHHNIFCACSWASLQSSFTLKTNSRTI